MESRKKLRKLDPFNCIQHFPIWKVINEILSLIILEFRQLNHNFHKILLKMNLLNGIRLKSLCSLHYAIKSNAWKSVDRQKKTILLVSEKISIMLVLWLICWGQWDSADMPKSLLCSQCFIHHHTWTFLYRPI